MLLTVIPGRAGWKSRPASTSRLLRGQRGRVQHRFEDIAFSTYGLQSFRKQFIKCSTTCASSHDRLSHICRGSHLRLWLSNKLPISRLLVLSGVFVGWDVKSQDHICWRHSRGTSEIWGIISSTKKPCNGAQHPSLPVLKPGPMLVVHNISRGDHRYGQIVLQKVLECAPTTNSFNTCKLEDSNSTIRIIQRLCIFSRS